ncbi:MAG: hypothetical protein K8R23_06805 [Chthoniobacter sp.]|nr:hypothetical protein [Chthoniobacter sp.]
MDAGIDSPFIDRMNPPEKKQKIERPIPTEEEFVAIIEEIRKPSWHSPKGRCGGQRPMSRPESVDFFGFLGRAGVGQAEAAARRPALSSKATQSAVFTHAIVSTTGLSASQQLITGCCAV